MKQVFTIFLLTILMSMVGTKVYAYDIAVENSDGVTIYYNYINDGIELEVTYQGVRGSASGFGWSYINDYSGNIVIPEQVTHMNRTRKVTAIGEHAFENSHQLNSVSLPNNIKNIGNSAFSWCEKLSFVNIPNGVTQIEDGTFACCYSLTSFTIPNNIISVGKYAFESCSNLTSISIPDNVTSIGEGAFQDCRNLTTLSFPYGITRIENNMFKDCSSLMSFTISDNISSIGEYAFSGCSNLKSIIIPNSITTLERSVFQDCGLSLVIIPNSIVEIGALAFSGCRNLISVTVPNSVTEIGPCVFQGCSNLTTIISKIEEPYYIMDDIFDYEIYMNASLFVPYGTKDKYKQTDGWKKFVFIEEGTGGGGTTTPEKCEKPTISYINGNLTFASSTEGATCQYNITDVDIKAGSGNEVQLTVTYNISVYATKAGYENSETATATLCWIDQQPTTEGITNEISQIPAKAVLIQSQGGMLTIQGVDDGSSIAVYTVSGQKVGSTKAHGNQASLATNIKKGEVAIIKIGEKSVKVVMQ